jgi:Ca2+-binding RTX toxin-like protein
MGRTPFLIAAVLCAAALLPAAASATPSRVFMSTSGSSINLNGTDGTRHEVSVSTAVITVEEETSTVFDLRDSAGAIATGDRCEQVSPNRVRCPAEAVTAIGVRLGVVSDEIRIGADVPAGVRTNLDGGSGDDVIVGGPGTDDIDGAGGADRLFGGPGNDILNGRNSGDVLDGGRGGDELSGGGGLHDIVTYETRTAGVNVSIGRGGANDGGPEDASPTGADTVQADVEQVLGGAGSDVLIGDSTANLLSGGAGADFLFGMDGNDDLLGGADADQLRGSGNADSLRGGPGADVFLGGSGRDRLRSRDRARDTAINCGAGRGDRVVRDKGDPRGKRCELPKRRKGKRHRRG